MAVMDRVESVRAFTESTPLYDVIPFRTTSTFEHLMQEVDKLIGNAPY